MMILRTLWNSSHIYKCSWRALVLFISLNCISTPSFAESCEVFDSWKLILGKVASSSEASMKDRFDLIKQEYVARETLASNLFHQYMNGDVALGYLDSCLQDQIQKESLLQVLGSVFYKLSVERLRAAHLAEVNRILDEVQQKFGSAPLFKVSDKTPENLNSNAAFLHGSRSIYQNFERISPKHWLFVFLHECLHLIDKNLEFANAHYNDVSLLPRLVWNLQRVRSFEELSAEDQNAVRQNIQYGFDLSAMAEARAFTAGILIYEAGKAKGLWSDWDWIEEFLATHKTSEQIAAGMRRLAFEKLHDPNESQGFWASPIVMGEYRRMKAAAIDY